MTFGQRLRQLRQLHGLTQGRLYERSGVSEMTIQRIENDRGGWNSQTIYCLAKAFNLSYSGLFEGVNPHLPVRHDKRGKRS